MLMRVAIWRRLLRHCVRLADSLARVSAGSRMEISNAMMPMTTSSSTSVKAARAGRAGRDGREAIALPRFLQVVLHRSKGRDGRGRLFVYNMEDSIGRNGNFS